LASLTVLNNAPNFTVDPIVRSQGVESKSYTGQSLAGTATDPDNNPLTYSKVSGPQWLSVASDGMLSGIPDNANVGTNTFTVKVTDNGGLSDTTTLTIQVINIYSGVAGIDDLLGLAANWLMQGCTDTPACNGADLDGDNDVDLADFAVLAYNWLADKSQQLYLNLDETSGTTAADDSGYSRPGTLINGPTWSTAGKYNGCLSFDGTDDYVMVPNYTGIGAAGGRTVSLWVKTSAAKVQELVQWGSDATGQLWLTRIQANGTVLVAVYGGGVYSTAVVTDGQWHHIAVVLDDGQTNSSLIRLYVDGLLDTRNLSGSCTISTAQTVPVYLGVWHQYNAGIKINYFQGLMDEVRIYNRALLSVEIAGLAH
jgi:hypothetical protein